MSYRHIRAAAVRTVAHCQCMKGRYDSLIDSGGHQLIQTQTSESKIAATSKTSLTLLWLWLRTWVPGVTKACVTATWRSKLRLDLINANIPIPPSCTIKPRPAATAALWNSPGEARVTHYPRLWSCNNSCTMKFSLTDSVWYQVVDIRYMQAVYYSL